METVASILESDAAERALARTRPVQAQPRVRARFYVPFMLALALLVASVAFGRLLPQDNVRPVGPGSSGQLNWSNGIFANRAELKAWLNEHGKSYAVWAAQHPAALKLIPEK